MRNAAQTAKAQAGGKSNCPLCAVGHDANKGKIWKLPEMDADHVRAWADGLSLALNASKRPPADGCP